MICQWSNMYAQLFGLLVLTCQIISNGSYEIHPVTDFIPTIKTELAVAATLPEGYVSFPNDHVAYKVHKEAVTWEEARDLCIAEGAHLAIADTVPKIKRIYGTVSDVHSWISVGIHRLNETNEYVRIDNGLPLTSLPWRSIHNPGNCGAIALFGEELVKFSCTLTLWYACEIPI